MGRLLAIGCNPTVNVDDPDLEVLWVEIIPSSNMALGVLSPPELDDGFRGIVHCLSKFGSQVSSLRRIEWCDQSRR